MAETSPLDSISERLLKAVAHDLRSPLYGIKGIADLLQERLGDQLDDNGRELMDHLLLGVSNLEKLLNALTSYSRISRSPVGETPVDLHDLVASISERLGVHLDLAEGTLPTVLGDAAHWTEVFDSILRNVVDHSGLDTPRASIVVSASVPWVIEIRDEGKGIEPRHQGSLKDILFTTSREHLGMGLAYAELIMIKYDGRLDVESEPGHGTTVRLSGLRAATGRRPHREDE